MQSRIQNVGQAERDLRERVAGLGAEGALAAHAAERARQTAAPAALDQHDQNQEQGRERQQPTRTRYDISGSSPC